MTDGAEVDLAELGAMIRSLSARLAAYGDARELANRIEEVCNAGYGAALALEAESRRTRRGIVTRPIEDDVELVRTLDAVEVASGELRRSLGRLRTRFDWLPPPVPPAPEPL
ncbi:MAG: hypothetical protein JWN32_4135 [Solirubrobacterales bacterium]|nr:hypothetical protein [Solirubrobacterales bacterium]